MERKRDALRIFRRKDTELEQWFSEQIGKTDNAYAIMRQALRCYSFFDGDIVKAFNAAQSLEEITRLFGNDWRGELKRLEEIVRDL